MRCRDCKHWTRLKDSDKFLPEDEIGECTGLMLTGDVEIEIKAGYDGGYINSIETNRDFFCKNFNKKLDELNTQTTTKGD